MKPTLRPTAATRRSTTPDAQRADSATPVLPCNASAPGRGLSRRWFLVRAAAAAGAGLVLPRARARRVSPSSRIRFALVGWGEQGRTLTDALLKIAGIEFAAIADIWDYSREYGRRYLKANGSKVIAYENVEDLLAGEKDLQAVIVATPDVWHAPVTNTCLKAGLHVYCEKMMSNTIEGARSMVRTMRETGRLLQIGHQRRSNPRYIFALQRLLREARICGRVTAANAQWNRAVKPDTGFPKGAEMPAGQLARYGFDNMRQFRNWRWFKKFGGGPLSDLGAHQIDIFNWFLGAYPKRVLAAGGLDYYKNRDWFDNAMVVYEYALPEGTTRALYQVQTTSSGGGGYFEYFMGTDGSLKMSENPNTTKLYREVAAPPWDEWRAKNYLRAPAAPLPQPTEAERIDIRESPLPEMFDIPIVLNKFIHQPHLENFFKAVRGEAKLNCPADEAFASEMAVFKACEAVDAQRTLTIGQADLEA